MAEVLRRLGHDAVVVEKDRIRPGWFASDVPIFGNELLNPSPDQILVLPEDQPIYLRRMASWPQRKVIYCQNHFYASISMDDCRTYADFGVTHLLCSGQTIYDFCRHRHPGLPARVIPIGVDSKQFYPREKRECIAYIPRKREVEASYIRDLFRFEYPEFRGIEWLKLERMSEGEIAAAVGKASVFLVLHRLDSLPLTGLEAMVSGCVLAGFTGIGGREYARPENGFWADEDDFPTCIRQLAEAVRLSRDTGPRRDAYAAACALTAAAYTPATFAEAIRVAWEEILQE